MSTIKLFQINSDNHSNPRYLPESQKIKYLSPQLAEKLAKEFWLSWNRTKK